MSVLSKIVQIVNMIPVDLPRLEALGNGSFYAEIKDYAGTDATTIFVEYDESEDTMCFISSLEKVCIPNPTAQAAFILLCSHILEDLEDMLSFAEDDKAVIRLDLPRFLSREKSDKDIIKKFLASYQTFTELSKHIDSLYFDLITLETGG